MYFLRKCSLWHKTLLFRSVFRLRSNEIETSWVGSDNFSSFFKKVKLLCTDSFECSEFSFYEMIITAQCRSPTVITLEYILLNPVSTLWNCVRKLLVGVERTTPEHAQNDSSKIDLQSFWSSSMSESWDNLNYISQHNFPDDNSVWHHSCYECAISNGSRTLVHFVTSLVTLITDHRMSGLEIRIEWRIFSTTRE